MKIELTQKKGIVTLNIEGMIGVPETWQFNTPEERVSTYEKLTAILRSIEESDVDTIRVNIRSTGGNIGDAMLIYEALRKTKAFVVTRCFGYVASAATIVAQAGCTGVRGISKNSLYLIHCNTSSVDGNAAELHERAQLLCDYDFKNAEIYAESSGRSKEFYLNLMQENSGEGRWLTAKEAVEYGLADYIISEEADPFVESSVKRSKFRGLDFGAVGRFVRKILRRLWVH